jgi:hypothetical protein
MGGACNTHEIDEKCIQYFGCKAGREDATWKMGRLYYNE